MATILLIDDDDGARLATKVALQRAGHDVVDAASAYGGLDHLDHGHVDVVVTDILMPEMDGLELIMKLRRRRERLPIIAVTGGFRYACAEREILSWAASLGADEGLYKPFLANDLVSKVEALVPPIHDSGY